MTLTTLADIARDNPALAAAPEPDRLRLITETGGNTLLLTWTAWQVGSGYCCFRSTLRTGQAGFHLRLVKGRPSSRILISSNNSAADSRTSTGALRR